CDPPSVPLPRPRPRLPRLRRFRAPSPSVSDCPSVASASELSTSEAAGALVCMVPAGASGPESDRCCVCCPPRCRSRCCCSRCWELCLPPCCLASCCVPPSCLPFWPGCGSSSEPTPCESGTCEAAGSTDGSGGRNTGEGAANDGVRDSDLLCPASSCDGWACPPVFGAPVAVPAVSVAAAWVVFDSAWVV